MAVQDDQETAAQDKEFVVSVRAAIVDRFENNEDAATVRLRDVVSSFGSDMLHPETVTPFIVVKVGTRQPHDKGGLDKSRGGMEVSDVTVVIVADSVAEAEKIIGRVRASLEATAGHGDTCGLTIRDRAFSTLYWRGDEVDLNDTFPDKAVGTVQYDVLAYRDCSRSACSSSSSG